MAAASAFPVQAAQPLSRGVQAVPPGIGIRLLEAPTNRKDDPRARTTVVDHVAPGTSFSRRFEATNGEDEPAQVKLFVRPARLENGAFVIDDTGTGEVQQWASVTPADGTVPAGGRLGARVSFDVPDDAPDGEFYGALIVEKPPPPGGQVRVAQRAAIAVYLSVGTGKEPVSDFSVSTLSAERDETGAPVVVAQVQNKGGRALSMSGSLRLADGPGGVAAGPFPAKLGTVLGVGQTAPVRVVLAKDLPDGPWTARLVMTSGRVERTVSARITFPTGVSVSASPVPVEQVAQQDPDGEDDLPLATVLVAGLLALAILAASAWHLFLRRRLRPV